MGSINHETRPVQVWIDADLGIAELVEQLNAIEGVRTHASCQGSIGEGGPEQYGPTLKSHGPMRRRAKYQIEVQGEAWGYLRPR
jgi:hypothetical protein